MKTAYGYAIPGGLIQFHLIGPEVLDADDTCVIPVDDSLSYAEAALTEPWACVVAAYTQRRRLEPKIGGLMWIQGQPGDQTNYQFSQYLDAPGTLVLSDVPPSLKEKLLRSITETTRVIEKDGRVPEDFPQFSQDVSGGNGFDDIILLKPQTAKMVSEAAKLIAFRGTFNIVS